MAVSQYFNNYSGRMTGEQFLMEDNIVESIKIMGHDCWYVPREGFNEVDSLFGENPQSKFERAYNMEMYLANVEGYEGDGDFFSKFGVEIRDTSNFICSRRSFERYIPSSIAQRPREGDLVFVPGLQKLFEIKFVEEELMFFSLGNRKPYIYEMRCELFRYSQESINTGVDEIDHVEHTLGYAIQIDVTTGSGNFYQEERVYQGVSLATSTASADVRDWDPTLKQLQLINIIGEFATGSAIKGATSNANYNISITDTLGDYLDYDTYDNKIIQTEADAIISFNEQNPFGEP
ncbi:neck protein [uncultured Caudovirales phage]|uniref:Neck protein n=1 Tax=uncultured Caudovirales phage TaxID=2100421 RepID=A0A6J5QKC5_9CAUD|nr:neck protein [uncultured Caudovirales phage]CAB4177181.1 neck protein [uncultured Caudovirales phage]CAB4181428.1 neck protein [uncultured Caudovirales phage]CAB4190892.1 neck protein [uncultured Caudovirales phage]CAB4211243.1 neck protein [uncultured Caudovirales phage]